MLKKYTKGEIVDFANNNNYQSVSFRMLKNLLFHMGYINIGRVEWTLPAIKMNIDSQKSSNKSIEMMKELLSE